MVTRLIKGQPAPLAIQRPKNQYMKRTKEEKKALKEKGLDARTKAGKAYLEQRRQATFEKERQARIQEEEERRENKIHTVPTIDTVADASSIALFSKGPKGGNRVTFRSLCGDGDMHVRLLKQGAFTWEDIPHRYTEIDITLKGEYYLSGYDCHNCPIAKLSGWISVYRCHRTFCILADEIERIK